MCVAARENVCAIRLLDTVSWLFMIKFFFVLVRLVHISSKTKILCYWFALYIYDHGDVLVSVSFCLSKLELKSKEKMGNYLHSNSLKNIVAF